LFMAQFVYAGTTFDFSLQDQGIFKYSYCAAGNTSKVWDKSLSWETIDIDGAARKNELDIYNRVWIDKWFINLDYAVDFVPMTDRTLAGIGYQVKLNKIFAVEPLVGYCKYQAPAGFLGAQSIFRYDINPKNGLAWLNFILAYINPDYLISIIRVKNKTLAVFPIAEETPKIDMTSSIGIHTLGFLNIDYVNKFSYSEFICSTTNKINFGMEF